VAFTRGELVHLTVSEENDGWEGVHDGAEALAKSVVLCDLDLRDTDAILVVQCASGLVERVERGVARVAPGGPEHHEEGLLLPSSCSLIEVACARACKQRRKKAKKAQQIHRTVPSPSLFFPLFPPKEIRRCLAHVA
jgi:hypothetical protein